MTRSTMLCGIAALFLLAGVAAAGEPAVELKVVKLGALDEAIAKHKGKIVVVDFWATFCIPCKAEFPNLVKMHQERARDGVVCMSVTVDDTDDQAAALKFLQKQQATFENFLIDEPAETYQKHYDFGAVPLILVFGKDGKLVKKFNAKSKDTAFTYKDVRQVVESLLK
ncbi:MAG: TlpA family protein disulfide reductase [Gemmataceae bacterium]